VHGWTICATRCHVADRERGELVLTLGFRFYVWRGDRAACVERETIVQGHPKERSPHAEGGHLPSRSHTVLQVREAVAEDGGAQRLVLLRDLWEDPLLYPSAERDTTSTGAVKRQAARALVRVRRPRGLRA
jgi:hypothetical protein